MTTDNPIDIFLDESFLKKLEKFKRLAQRRSSGNKKGEYYTQKSGSSVEFLDYRNYQIGDDLRYVDWNAYSRLDKLFIKLFRAEKNQTIHILMDTSKSMAAGSPPKHLVAKKIAAAIGFIGLSHMNDVMIRSFSNTLSNLKRKYHGKNGYLPMIRHLLSLAPSDTTMMDLSLGKFSKVGVDRGSLILLSDLLDPEGFEKGVAALDVSRLNISVIQILDSEELTPSFQGHFTLSDMETGKSKKMVLDAHFSKRYEKKMDAYLKKTQRVFKEKGIDYHLLNTSISFEQFMIDYVTRSTLFN